MQTDIERSVNKRLENWLPLLENEIKQAYFAELLSYVASQRAQGIKVFPEHNNMFRALALVPPSELKVVILGQDPYHGLGQADGLSFSVQKGIKIPPSLRNIYKELARDIPHFRPPEHGDLSTWATQGVLLLNTVLSVEEGLAHSHKGKGWESFTDEVIKQVSEHLDNVVFMLWGKPAQNKLHLIDATKHCVLQAAHPSPLSAHRGFLGCGHFSQANLYLRMHNKNIIDWQS